MRKSKAVVLEKTGGFFLVLDSNGAFRRVRACFKAEVGEEIEIAANQTNKTIRVLVSVAALFLLTVLATLGWSSWQTPLVVATVSVDINPSLELDLDKETHIVNVKAKNDGALQLLQGVDLKGQTFSVAINRLVERAVELNFLNEERKWIVLGLLRKSEESERTEVSEVSKVSEEEVLGQTNIVKMDFQALLSKFNEEVAAKGLGLQVVMFKLTCQEDLEAQKSGLSLGEYALWQSAEKAGIPVAQQAVKDSVERSQLLDMPAVQTELQHNPKVIKSKSPAEQTKRKTNKSQDPKKEEEKDKLPAKEKTEKQNSSEAKHNTNLANDKKTDIISVNGKNNNMIQVENKESINTEKKQNKYSLNNNKNFIIPYGQFAHRFLMEKNK